MKPATEKKKVFVDLFREPLGEMGFSVKNNRFYKYSKKHRYMIGIEVSLFMAGTLKDILLTFGSNYTPIRYDGPSYMADGGMLAFPVWMAGENGEKRDAIFYCTKFREAHYVDQGRLPFWMSDHELGYVKNERLYRYDVSTGIGEEMKNEKGEPIALPLSWSIQRISCTADGAFISYTTYERERFLWSYAHGDAMDWKLYVTALPSGESRIIQEGDGVLGGQSAIF